MDGHKGPQRKMENKPEGWISIMSQWPVVTIQYWKYVLLSTTETSLYQYVIELIQGTERTKRGEANLFMG